jgi:hypothetical protein
MLFSCVGCFSFIIEINDVELYTKQGLAVKINCASRQKNPEKIGAARCPAAPVYGDKPKKVIFPIGYYFFSGMASSTRAEK